MNAGAIVAVLLVGFSAGLRTFTAPAVLAWAAYLDLINVGVAPFGFMSSGITVTALTIAAVGEYIFDLLPFAPARTALPGLIGRFLSGSFCAAVLSLMSGGWLILGLLGGSVAIAGAFAGFNARAMLVRRLAIRDFIIAIPEDMAAIALTIAAVCLIASPAYD